MSNRTSARAATGRGWIAGVVAILGATVALNFYVLHLASDDPSFAIEPDYYARALRWDEELAQRDRNAALGWRATPALMPGDAAGSAVAVRLDGADGAPVRGATVRVQAFAVARASERLEATLAPRADGSYGAPLGATRAGAWEIRIEAVRGGERFTSVHRLDVPASRGAVE